ncbi:MAG: hypothetical protein M1813_006429 [Trichoglossum hirsutum]|nr:MAG: hypothetical protein M1813_007440 [Trichoglossum hirsutum]KAI9859886.1 MAG: hypothetical protein M1813_006429 [Trichoglossum hirsutum]
MFCSRHARSLLLANVLANVFNSFALADQNPHGRDVITSIYPAEGFDLLQACSKWCLDGRCHGSPGTPGCSNFMPKTGSADGPSFIEEQGCFLPGCICEPTNGFYQRTMEAAYKCLQDRCRREGTSDNAFKAEVDQVGRTIKNYCTSHNIVGNFTYSYPALPTSTATNTSAPQGTPTSTATKTSTPQEGTRWKPQDIATVTIAIIACIVPFIIAGIQGFRARDLRIEQKTGSSGSAGPTSSPNAEPDPSQRPDSRRSPPNRTSPSGSGDPEVIGMVPLGQSTPSLPKT